MALKIIIVGASLIALFIVVVLIAASAFRSDIESEIVAMFEQGELPDRTVITEADIESLPEPIQRHLRYAQVVGKSRVQYIRLRQRGMFRTRPDQAWMPIEADQYYTVDPPAFVWHARMQMIPLVSVVIRDKYLEGEGEILGKLLSIVTVAHGTGREINQGALLRFLNEIMWFPTAYLSDYLTWEEIDSSSARVRMSYGGISASAVLYIDKEGKLIDFVCDRYIMTDSGSNLEEWSTPISGYGEFEGLRLPTEGEGVWRLKSGDFSYFRLKIESIEYGRPELF
ncbi:MAG: hypothetical protein FJ215_01075 [Ignavibacteria bacterium]|nr:hypothetical protein [Ignavibacteria bacterium]